MDSRFNTGIVIRVLIIVILAGVTAYSVVVQKLFFTPLVSGVLLIIAVTELIFHLNLYSRNLNNFLITIKQSGFNASFPTKPGHNRMFESFNEIIQAFHRLSMEKEAGYQFLQTLTDSIEVGLIAFEEHGGIKWINPEGKKIIEKPGIQSLKELKDFHPMLANEIESLKFGQKSLVRLKQSRDYLEISIQKNQVNIGGEILNIVLMQNVHLEMEIKEIEAWQKLVRVMRHEIMNSMTPIVNLTEAVNSVLKSKGEIYQTDADFVDIQESLLAVENRGKGLIKFVSAYKDFSHKPELNITDFRFLEMINRIGSLLDEELTKKNTKLHLDIKPETVKIKADEELIEQVVINLIKNSLESIDKIDGFIKVFCRLNKESCLIKLSDNGSGIPDDVLDRVFVPFFTTKSNGSGIGLSLCRQIIHQHGGQIYISETSPKGTILNIEL